MGKELDYYAYLSEHTIRRLYAQIKRPQFLSALGLEIALELPFVKLKATTGEGPQEELAAQAKAVVAHLQRNEADHIGTVDAPKRYIKGTLPMFSYFLPQGFGSRGKPPELIYFGGATDTTILGLAGAASYVYTSTDGEMPKISSALPNLTRVIAQSLRVKIAYKRGRYDENQALDAMQYMDECDRPRAQLEEYAFFAKVKLDSHKVKGRISYPTGKHIVLAWPFYVAHAG
jgi:hypothetical protein